MNMLRKVDRLSGCFITITLLLAGVTIWGIGVLTFNAVDYVGVTEKRGSAEVVGRDHRNAYTSFTMAGKVPITAPHPERWYLKIMTSDGPDCIHVTERIYENVPDGHTIEVEYQIGRFSQGVRITSTNLDE